MIISTSFTEHNGSGDSAMIITVDYNNENEIVKSIESVGVLDYHTGRITDITKQMTDLFDISLDLVIKNIDWAEVYAETKEQQEVESYDQV